jgi:hypothetical protein
MGAKCNYPHTYSSAVQIQLFTKNYIVSLLTITSMEDGKLSPSMGMIGCEDDHTNYDVITPRSSSSWLLI